MEKVIKSKLLSQFRNIKHWNSTKFFWWLSFKFWEKNDVVKNRKNFFNELDLSLDNSVFLCEKNHTDNIIIVDKNDIWKWAFWSDDRIKNTDAMITNSKYVNLVIYTSDCVPVLIFDPVKKVLAAVHSWRKWTMKKIVIKTIKKMEEEFWSNIKDLIVTIWPSAWPCCYFAKYKKQIDYFWKEYWNLIQKDWRIFLNLWDSIEKDLLKNWILSKNIENKKICTMCNCTNFASHRNDIPSTTTNLTTISLI